MCGIVGVISKQGPPASVIQSMNNTLIHRGPDDEGYLLGGTHESEITLPQYDLVDSPIPFAFGHRRLAILDLSEQGHQPMCYRGRYWIVYNGEVYNHVELREELEALGYTFRSQTDTEVIMASYDAWGVDCLNRFNGMWAFVLYDSVTKEFFISRDRFGIKPLYYYLDDQHFVFGSEIKALLKHPAVTREPNIEYCKLFLKEGSKDHLRETAFMDIYRFECASFLKCKIEEIFQPFKEAKFWSIQPNLSYEPYDEAKSSEYTKQYYDLLADAVRLRLRADVKVGSALSGGLDSSSVVYLVNQQLKAVGCEDKQETFSSVYQTPGSEYCDESRYIEEMARFLDVRSNTIEPKSEDIIEEHRKFVYYLDTPATNTVMSSWHTYKLTKACGVTVTLDGQGADEQMAGYLQYLMNYFSTVPLGTLIRELSLYRQIPNVSSSIGLGFVLNLSRHLFGEHLSLSLLNRLGKKFTYTPVNQRLSDDLILSLGTLFHWADRGSMAFSIESRMPFMDYRLVEFLATVPATYKLHGGWTKYLARRAFDGKLPDSVCWRRDKMGWPIPEEFWFKGKLKEHLVRTLKDSEFLLRVDVNFSDLNETEVFDRYSFAFLLRCYILEIWYSVFWERNTHIPLSPGNPNLN